MRNPLVSACFACLCVFYLAFQFCEPVTAENNSGTRNEILIANCHLRSIDQAELASEYSGILVQIVKPGVRVKAGSVVAQLDDALAKARLAVAAKEAASDVEIRFAKKTLEFAQLKYERAMNAESTLAGTISEVEIKELRLSVEKALLQLEQAQNQFELSQLRKQEVEATVRQKRIIVPFDGFVRAVHKEPGEVVNEGETILEVVNTDRLRIEGHLALDEIANVKVGDQVAVQIAAGRHVDKARIVRGRVVFLDISVEPVSQKARILAEIPNSDGLLYEGMLASMVILQDQASERP